MDCNQIATGILIAAEQMQFPSGPFAGCEPDSFVLARQSRNGPAINPCAIVSLLLAVEGNLDSLAVATGDGHRVVAPFPASIRNGEARIKAHEGVAYQVVVDGERIVQMQSRGDDTVALAAK
jgi:alpha-D-ribose 1-methylphosphonate 5-triphosphate synthase subunit PhnI